MLSFISIIIWKIKSQHSRCCVGHSHSSRLTCLICIVFFDHIKTAFNWFMKIMYLSFSKGTNAFYSTKIQAPFWVL